jgi:small subunit ribosomal protein S5
MAVVGDGRGHVGLGKAKKHFKKSTRDAASSYQSSNGVEDLTTKDPHTVPFNVEGKCGSVRIKLIPAPRGTGLDIGDEGKKILRLAGIRDVYGVTTGQTRTTFNFAKAIMDALSKTDKMKL